MNGNLARAAAETGQFRVFYPENNGNEGLYINVMALFIELFGSTRFALRLASAAFGTVTVWGLALLGGELFSPPVGLLGAFLAATSFWHLNFSRIATHGISAPCLLVWALWLLLVALRRRRDARPWQGIMLLAGLVYGLGFYTYLAYRITPLLMAGVWLHAYRRESRVQFGRALGLFLGAAIVAATPLAIHFMLAPADLTGRVEQVSLFQSPHPPRELMSNLVKTAGMFFVAGDANWRHNYNQSPELFWPVAVLFLIGCLIAVLRWRRTRGLAEALALGWLVVAAIPEVVSTEGIPHAFRAILMIPPVFFLAAVAAVQVHRWLREAAPEWICVAVSAVFLAVVSVQPVHTYFGLWAHDPHLAAAFDASMTRAADYINTLPKAKPKLMAAESRDLEHGIPLFAQPVAFLTDSFTPAEQQRANIRYVNPGNFPMPAGAELNEQEFCRFVKQQTPGAVVICLLGPSETAGNR
jgi:hypothetical protein